MEKGEGQPAPGASLLRLCFSSYPCYPCNPWFFFFLPHGIPGGLPMITLLGSERRLCDGLTRRETLKAGALSLLGGAFNLPSLLALEQNRPAHAPAGKAKSVIL